MRKFLSVLVVILMMTMAVVPGLAQDDAENLVERAVRATNFNTLIAAAQAAGLADTLANDGPFTVFAPTDGAFARALADLGVSAEDLLADTETLTSILLYHVVEGEVFAADVVALVNAGGGVAEVPTLNGATITVQVIDGVPYLNGTATSVFLTDLTASNGVIHVIDNVLLPPMGDMAEEEMMEEDMAEEEMGTIVDVAVSNPDFSILVDAVLAADPAVVEALSGEGPLTVFAPTNDAFVAALEALGLTAEDLLADTETLTTILTYHVVAGEFLAADVVGLLEENGGSVDVDSVQGEPITVSLSEDGNVMVNNATVVATDVMASNGVIHVIDAVILPPSVVEALGLGMEEEMAEEEMAAEEMGTIVDVAVSNPDFSILVDAVLAADPAVVEALSGEGPLTVFAPTNDAFVAALEALGLTAEELLADTETLTAVLTYHVVAGEFLAADVVALLEENGGSVEVDTVNGAPITISLSEDGNVMVNDATVIATDVMASNGVIHVIDSVILPPAE